MGIFQIFRESLYSPSFYRTLPGRPFSFSVKYFYTLAIAFSLALTIYFAAALLPGLSALMKTIIPEAIETFPAELTVTIENGEARSNVEEPYFIEFPEKLEMLGDRDSDRRLAVVDTRNEFTPERFREYNAYVWLGRTSLIFGDENGEIRIRELRDFPDIVLNRETLRVLGAKAEESYGWLVPLLMTAGVLIAFVLLLGYFSFNLVYLLIFAVLVMVIARFRKLELGYKDSYRIGIHATSPALILMVLSLVGVPILPFLFTAVSVAVVWANLQPEITSPLPA